MFVKIGLLLTIVCTGLLTPNIAKAAIFKCVGSDGEVSYNQMPCPVAQETAKVIHTSSANTTQHDCRIANNFARRTATGMRSGLSSGEMFASYGGIDAIPRTAIGVINYVYTHKGNLDTRAERVAALSAARCSAGSYGSVACDDFPYGFIAELGGCETASKSTLASQKPTSATASVDTGKAPQNANTQALGVRTVSDDSTSSSSCKDTAQSQLSELFAQMNSGESLSSEGELEAQKNELTTQLAGC